MTNASVDTSATVQIPTDQIKVGDILMWSGKRPHLVTALVPYEGVSFDAGTLVAVCDNGWSMTLSGSRYEILRRADECGGR